MMITLCADAHQIRSNLFFRFVSAETDHLFSLVQRLYVKDKNFRGTVELIGEK